MLSYAQGLNATDSAPMRLLFVKKNLADEDTKTSTTHANDPSYPPAQQSGEGFGFLHKHTYHLHVLRVVVTSRKSSHVQNDLVRLFVSK
jgi:hypothetical protein